MFEEGVIYTLPVKPRNVKIICSIVFIIFVLGVALLGLDKQDELNYSEMTPAFAYNKVIRFHVVANSDSLVDQTVKYKVRDYVLNNLQSVLCGVDSIDRARELIKENLDYISILSQEKVEQSGMYYPVRVEIGKYEFPVKSYGGVIYPAGQYEALRIILGEGVGQNWWCVLFPPLCFVNGSSGPVADDYTWPGKKQNISPVLAPSEKNVYKNDSSSATKIRFRLWEIWSGR